MIHIRHPAVNRPDARLVVVTTADHAYTSRGLPQVLGCRGVGLVTMPWEELFRQRSVPGSAWVLTDFDRLSPSELEAATRIAGRLRAGGNAVLNDPGAFRPRHAFLEMLRHAGLGSIATWWPAAGVWPDRFPVLLRCAAAHRGVIGELIHDAAAARSALAAARADGYALADLIFVAFAAQQTADGVWQKHAAFRIGARIVRANTVNDTHWMAKTGTRGAASAGFYAAELAEMTDYPHAAQVRSVFDAAGLDFGRLDFGFVDGRMTVYEINTNPDLGTPAPHPDPARNRTMATMMDQIAEALAVHAWACPDPAPVRLAGAFRRAGKGPFRRPRRA